jgi:hypothetical protein
VTSPSEGGSKPVERLLGHRLHPDADVVEAEHLVPGIGVARRQPKRPRAVGRDKDRDPPFRRRGRTASLTW